MTSPPYEYDVALSFAGEERDYVEEVARILRDRGISVFYDAFEKATLWGKNLYEHLDDVYRNRARFVVIFASEAYANKAWPSQERRSAQAAALSSKREYILPARFDDTAIPGLLPTVAYVDLRETTPTELADLVVEKIGMAATIAAQPAAPTNEVSGWEDRHRERALAGLQALGKQDFYEVVSTIRPLLAVATQLQLDEAVARSNIHTFGWPIAVHFATGDGRPRPLVGGILAEFPWHERSSYDLWFLGLEGRFYLLHTLSEDALDRPEAILFNTRIVRVAETLLFLRNLYSALGAPPTSTVTVTVRHVGLSRRELSASGTRRHTMHKRTSVEDEIRTTVEFQLADLDAQLVTLVRSVLNPLFALYDYYEPGDVLYTQIISDFLRGEVT